MVRPRYFWLAAGLSTLAFTGFLIGQQDPATPRPEAEQEAAANAVEHPECSFFGPQRERFLAGAPERLGGRARSRILSTTTDQVMRAMAVGSGSPQSHSGGRAHAEDSIDSYIWADFARRRITPAERTNDWEFARRVTLDLTGRIPTTAAIIAFVSSTAADKRAKLVEDLLADPTWVDKWTMFFGDLYQNVDSKPSTGLRRFPEGRNAFYAWIRDSLAKNKPYNQMATEMIAGTTENTYEAGASNYILNGYITGGPTQDVMDQSTSFVFDTFLGMAYVNCVLCHNGRGHLDQLSLWGSRTTRYQSWQLASYMSRTTFTRGYPDPNNRNIYYWNVADNPRATDYALNTTTGNRPSRVAPSGCRSGQPCFYVPPQYIFTSESPRAGENYRVALARQITGDIQFARATVNYVWAHMFGRGIVDPPNTFDPARLDPNNPPPDPWTLQPSNPALLNALARHFVDSGYNLKALMREIANSDVYQLSSRYEGNWNPDWEPYFARKFVRRLWGEEIHDAVALSSGTLPQITLRGFTDLGFDTPSYAMQLPDITGGGDGQALLDNFIRGNRDDQPRKYDGSILQALTLMNNNFVVQRSHATGTNASRLISQNLTKSNPDLINLLYVTILSRMPSETETKRAMAAIPASGSTRTAAVQDLVWSLYNKVDFIFNY
jgi:hypothetical protein